MLLPDNIHPEDTIYYNGSFVLKALTKNPKSDMLDLYLQTAELKKMTMQVFMLCLDWLYLLDILKLDKQGKVELCT